MELNPTLFPPPPISITSRHSAKTATPFGSSWHPFKEHQWRSSETSGTGPLRGGPATAGKLSFPPLCPRWAQMTSVCEAGRAAPSPALISALGTYQPLVTKIIGLHLQHGSQHCLWSGNWSPGLFRCVSIVQINTGNLGSWKRGKERGKQYAADIWVVSALGLSSSHTFAQDGSGGVLVCLQRALVAHWRYDGWRLAASSQEVTKKCRCHQSKCRFACAAVDGVPSGCS